MIKTSKELVVACMDLAQNHKTLYVMGCFGAPMTESNKSRYIQHHSYNQRADRKKMIQAATADTFGFDCVCMIKGLLWGWAGDKGHIYGGASYASNGVPDVNANQMITLCSDISTNFDNIRPGELLWMQGHVGIYVGNGNAVECTPGWKNGVQVTAVRNIQSGSGHTWIKHGKLPFITYEAAGETAGAEGAPGAEKAAVTGLPTLKRGSKGDGVKVLQVLLNLHMGGGLEIDGSFGPATENALEAFQEDMDLDVDGKCGPQSWAALLGGS